MITEIEISFKPAVNSHTKNFGVGIKKQPVCFE